MVRSDMHASAVLEGPSTPTFWVNWSPIQILCVRKAILGPV